MELICCIYIRQKEKKKKTIYKAYSDIIFFCHNQILQQMRSDIALLTVEDGGSPIRNPSTAAEDARLASLISLDGILKQVKVFTFVHTLLYPSLYNAVY